MSEKDIVTEARAMAGDHRYDIQPSVRAVIHSLANEVDWWRAKTQDASELDDIRHCDKCDLCEDHHD